MQNEEKAQNDLAAQLDKIAILENINELVAYHDMEMRVVWANKTACVSVGRSLDELVGRHCYSIWAKRSELCVDCPVIRVRETGKPHSADIPAPDGRYWFIRGYPVLDQSGSINGMIEITTDITERKLAEFAQKQSEERYRTILKIATDGFTVSDLDGKLLEVNDSYCNMTGYTREELLAMNIADIEAVETFKEAARHGKKIIEQGYDRFETRHRCKDGRIIDLEVSANYIDVGGGQIFVSFRDVTERNRAEKVLRESEEKLRLMFESVSDGIAMVDLDGNIVQINTADVVLHGFTDEEELIGRSAFDLVAERDRQKIVRSAERVVETGRIKSIECNLLRKDGTEFPAELSAAVLKDISGNPFGIIGIIKDITERKVSEEKLRRDERIESIGTLAGGIAHDFNNLLTAIMGNIALAKRHVKSDEEVFDMLDEAEKASLRARDLTHQLMTFSRGGAPIKKIISLAELIEESATFALHGANIRPEFFFQEDLWSVEADGGQINRVIHNLVKNADEAMPDGGVVTINARNITHGDGSTLPLKTGKYVEITVIDSGIGIKKKHLPKIFEPYFTTKQKGSGMGLATVYSIISKHDGHIVTESVPSTGTTIKIYLPASNKAVSEEEEQEIQLQLMGKGKVLVMDDEEIIRELLYRILSNAGYHVELSSNGSEAIELYVKAGESGEPFDVVIMDLTIPGGMGGKEAIAELLELDPDVKAIVSSGYASDPIMSEYDRFGFSAVVTKPYNVAEIETTIQSLLEKKK